MIDSKTIVLVTGGFDPVHRGHVECFKAAKQLGDILIVGLNSDEWLRRKKGKPFMPFNERQSVLNAFRYIDNVIDFDDSDETAKDAIKKVRNQFPKDKIIFANGGDRTSSNVPEMEVTDSNLEFVFSVGGSDKANSSSWILNEWKNALAERNWGNWKVLYDTQGCKVKELVVEPGRALSMQKHNLRSEFWFVVEGTATVYWDHGTSKVTKHQFEIIHVNEWHRLANETDKILKIVEIQYGSQCEESDILRK